MRVALFGYSGQLGICLRRRFDLLNWNIVSVGRQGASVYADLHNTQSLTTILKSLDVDIIVNTAAITDINFCENQREQAWLVNCLSSNILSDHCNNAGIKYVYISTDQVYENDNNFSTEKDLVVLNNNYANTKYWGEPRSNLNALTIRTSFFGLRSKGREGFVNHLVNSIQNDEKINLYQNVFTSALAADSCAELVIELIKHDAVGVYNVGTKNCYTKAEFGLRLLNKLGKAEVSYELVDKPISEVKVNGNVGMNCSKVENCLNIKLPQIDDVVSNIIKQIRT